MFKKDSNLKKNSNFKKYFNQNLTKQDYFDIILTIGFIFYYMIYFVLIFSDIICPWVYQNLDTTFWSSIIIGCTLFFIGLFLILNFHDNVKLYKISLIFILFGLIGMILLSYFYYINIESIYKNIVHKLISNNNFEPVKIIREGIYGQTIEDINNKLNLELTGFDDLESQTTFEEFWYQIMKDPIFMKSCLKKALIDIEYKESDIESYNLFWLLCNHTNNFVHLSRQEIAFLIGLDKNKLYEMYIEICNLKNSYNYLDKNSPFLKTQLIFYFLTNHIVYIDQKILNKNNNFKNKEFCDRYKTISKYNSEIVYNLSFLEHKIIDHNNLKVNIYPPHIYLALKRPTDIENILSDINYNNLDEIIQNYEIVKPIYFDGLDNSEKIHFIQNELALYTNILKRPNNMIHPPNFINILKHKKHLTKLEINNILSYYTNKELIDAYDPREEFKNRNDLIKTIIQDIKGEPRWGISNKFCNNDDSTHVLEFEKRHMINKYDKNDPIISFGTHKNYSCFTASELCACFREYEINGVNYFIFLNPDMPVNNSNNKIMEFSIDNIKQLLELLNSTIKLNTIKLNTIKLNNKIQPDDIISKLKKQIEFGLKSLESSKNMISNLKRQYNEFKEEEKYIIDLYFSWMFAYGMWMRFWKGPGNSWITNQEELNKNTDIQHNPFFINLDQLLIKKSTVQERNEYVIIQDLIRTNIMLVYEKNINLTNWINNLSTIYYDFETNESKLASYPIKSILDKISAGNYCIGFGSDTIVKTSYFYIIELLSDNSNNNNLGGLYKKNHEFDKFMNQKLINLLDMEKNTIIKKLDSLRKIEISQGLTESSIETKNILINRLKKINDLDFQQFYQPPFSSKNYKNNIHVDI